VEISAWLFTAIGHEDEFISVLLKIPVLWINDGLRFYDLRRRQPIFMFIADNTINFFTAGTGFCLSGTNDNNRRYKLLNKGVLLLCLKHFGVLSVLVVDVEIIYDC
jgi:hypothetical protein